ncbi:restriction endonuclease subunit S [Shewanella algae]|uniref:restriction endonuclease subunit S n=1 Tax=Shewanella algae TaxID=38313 RepID=UPI0031F55245
MSAEKLITESAMDGVNVDTAGAIIDHIDIWTSAVQAKSASGRGSGKKRELYGIKKLRELILELAVRGKLVPQDPSDEPASVLLERIAAEKAQLVKDGKIRKDKNHSAIELSDIPYELPNGWEWSRLGNVSSASTGFAFKTSQYQENGTFVLRVTNINVDGSINKNDNKYISPISASEEFSKYQLAKDDILLVMVGGSLGKLGRVTEDVLPAVLNQNMWKLDRFGAMPVEYFLCGLTHINSHQIQITASTHGHLAQGEYMDKLFPVPPLAEQHRIVAKVDELMALCDQLEQQTKASLDAHQVLVETLLATLTNSQDATELMGNWGRISEHFDTLLTTEQSIEQLKQTILQLSVMGKLVPQDPNDEPAAKLLERIAEEKAQLIKEKKIKKQKALPPIAEDEKPFELPKGWEWSRFGQVVVLKSGCTFGQDREGETGTIYCKVGDMNLDGNFEEITTSSRYIQPLSGEKSALIPAASIIFPKRGGAIATNKKRYVRRDIFVDPNIMATTPSSFLKLEYVMTWLDGFDLASLNSGTSVPQINNKDIDPLLFPVPPLAEQKRIVDQVDLLLALCDQIKQRLRDSQQTQLQLTDAIVEQAL